MVCSWSCVTWDSDFVGAVCRKVAETYLRGRDGDAGDLGMEVEVDGMLGLEGGREDYWGGDYGCNW